MMNKKLSQKIKTIPHSPGCYRYYNKKGDLIYIGKAKDLRKRISSYFIGATPARLGRGKDPKTVVLVENIADIKWEVTESEIEALVLESLLIKKNKPRFNIKIKDDKDFLWVKIDMSREFPYPELIRRPDVETIHELSLRGKIKYFGPFTDSKLLKQGLAVLRKIFLWRDCSESKFSFYKKKNKPCLEYYIKNCGAPCCNYVNNNDYQLGIKQLVVFLRGGKKKLVNGFEKKMKTFSKSKEFEKAAVYRDRLRSLQNIDANLRINKMEADQKIKDLEGFIDRINLDLGYNLEQKKGFRIEFYDISNIFGKEAVGSMIVWQDGGFNKNQYRKFKIKYTKGPNDVGMMKEVLFRRARYLKSFTLPFANGRARISNLQASLDQAKPDKNQNSKLKFQDPDLIVLDGGKPQLGEIYKLFRQLKIEIPLLSLAKREEEVWGVSYKVHPVKSCKQFDGVNKVIKFIKLNIQKNSPEGFFIQRLRDEAHRFAIGYHKSLRNKKIIKSRLDEIEGIGPVTKKKLLLKFGSVDGIIRADLIEVENVVGKNLAKKIKENL